MSVTCVLVPVLEPEAEALLQGDAAAVDAVVARATPLRTRIADVDALREELHAALFDRWDAAKPPPPALLRTFRRVILREKPTVTTATGYDPFVHLFGRSLPADGRTPAAVAARLKEWLALDDTAFDAALARELGGLSPKAAALWTSRTRAATATPAEVITREATKARTAFAAEELRAALDAVVRLQAWSWPVWRFDGEMLGPLLRTLGVRLEAGGARDLFVEIVEPARLDALEPTLPKALEDFDGAGLYLSSAQVKVLAGALRLQRGRIAENIRSSGEAEAVLRRHQRLLEEAVIFCESQDLALCEAAGVEWHDRAK